MTPGGPLLIITGPTAVGKTALSIQAAKALGGEVVSADSMQVYRHMDIGSAKVTRDEMEDTVREARQLSEVFTAIADRMEHILPERSGPLVKEMVSLDVP